MTVCALKHRSLWTALTGFVHSVECMLQHPFALPQQVRHGRFDGSKYHFSTAPSWTRRRQYRFFCFFFFFFFSFSSIAQAWRMFSYCRPCHLRDQDAKKALLVERLRQLDEADMERGGSRRTRTTAKRDETAQGGIQALLKNLEKDFASAVAKAKEEAVGNIRKDMEQAKEEAQTLADQLCMENWQLKHAADAALKVFREVCSPPRVSFPNPFFVVYGRPGRRWIPNASSETVPSCYLYGDLCTRATCSWECLGAHPSLILVLFSSLLLLVFPFVCGASQESLK